MGLPGVNERGKCFPTVRLNQISFSQAGQPSGFRSVVIASGYLEPDLQNNLQSAGISHVVDKPYIPDDVLKVVESLIGTEKS
jgi:hypothetical protein